MAIFDEAQRAWDMEQLSKFMEQKKGVPDFNKSEPESLIEFMDRHKDWATIVCLVGGGQEINTGEGGTDQKPGGEYQIRKTDYIEHGR